MTQNLIGNHDAAFFGLSSERCHSFLMMSRYWDALKPGFCSLTSAILCKAKASTEHQAPSESEPALLWHSRAKDSSMWWV